MRPIQLQGIFEDKSRLYTKSMAPGICVYGEKLRQTPEGEFREWDAMRSKLGAGIKKGISQIGIKPGSIVLYLGCSTGTTVSHVSDIVGPTGKVYAVDVAPRVMREIIGVASHRPNIFPIMADAFAVTQFIQYVPKVDVVFMDIAQANQVDIFLRNVQTFLKPGGFGLLSLKARSVDIAQSPQAVFAQARIQIEQQYPIVDYKTLDPFEKDHALFVIKVK
jgi:fibrillarin-like pre-rRNA processing protein